MKKITYKLFIGLVFGFFVTLGKILFTSGDVPVFELLASNKLWMDFMIFFGLGYIILGNMLWNAAQKNKKE